MRIFDPNYGKRDNFWFGLPLGQVIYTEIDDLIVLIQASWEEMDRRRTETHSGSKKTYQPSKLIIDEFNQSFRQLKSLSKELYERAFGQFLDLVFMGHGYGVFVTAGVQTLAVGTTQMDRATQKQLNCLLLGYSAVDMEEVSRIAPSGKSEELISRVERVRRLPGGKYAGLLKLESEPVQVQVIPYFDLNQYQINLPVDNLTPEKRWVENLNWAEIGADDKSLSQAWKESVEGAPPEVPRRQGGSNSYYQAFKRRFEACD